MPQRAASHDQLIAHQAAAQEIAARMRATNANTRQTIRKTMEIVHDSREVVRRVDALLRAP
jgi:hypothetical protein